MKLSYGNGVSCDISSADVTWVRANAPRTMTDQDVVAAVERALARPVDYPDLASATVPGDLVTIALDYQTPQMMAVVRGTLAALGHGGVDTARITLLLASEFAADAPLQTSIRDLVGEDARIVVHTTDDEEQISLLGISAANRPLRLHRVLCDADLVIPIGPTRGHDTDAELGGHLFPRFSDHETQARYHAPDSHETLATRRALSAEAHECEWKLGVGLALQVVPGPAGSVAAVHCGTPAGAAAAAHYTYRQVWQARVPERADLVVATIVGDGLHQTWLNLSRALAIADDLLSPGGAIAICSEITSRPGPSGKRLRDAADLSDIERKILRDNHHDSLAALQLCRALQRGTVYLRSRLDAAVVERFGLAPIESDSEIQRLVHTYRRTLVLEEAQYLLPALAN